LIAQNLRRADEAPRLRLERAEEAGEIIESDWMALLRDVPFSRYGTDPLAAAAAADLDRLSDFRGPRAGGRVTTGTLFRGVTPGDLTGPYLSQFLLRTALFGAEVVEQRVETTLPGMNVVRTNSTWLAFQRGTAQPPAPIDPARRFIRSGRDIGRYVHIDTLFRAYFDACLILAAPVGQGGVGARLNPGGPCVDSRGRVGPGAFDAPHVSGVIGEVAVRALKSVWLRRWLLHATVAGACVTVLKWFFDETSPVADPAQPNVHADPALDGGSLVPYTGPGAGDLTAGGELNKLAANIAIGRNHAGVQWRSDSTASLALGEAVAIATLEDLRETVNERFEGRAFTTFAGERITV
jgi:hypothetical protein